MWHMWSSCACLQHMCWVQLWKYKKVKLLFYVPKLHLGPEAQHSGGYGTNLDYRGVFIFFSSLGQAAAAAGVEPASLCSAAGCLINHWATTVGYFEKKHCFKVTRFNGSLSSAPCLCTCQTDDFNWGSWSSLNMNNQRQLSSATIVFVVIKITHVTEVFN